MRAHTEMRDCSVKSDDCGYVVLKVQLRSGSFELRMPTNQYDLINSGGDTDRAAALLHTISMAINADTASGMGYDSLTWKSTKTSVAP